MKMIQYMAMETTDKVAILLGDMPENKSKFIDKLFTKYFTQEPIDFFDSPEQVQPYYKKVVLIGDMKVSAKIKKDLGIINVPFNFDLTQNNVERFVYLLGGVLKTSPVNGHEIVKDINRVHQIFTWCKEAGEFAFDFETEGLEWWKDKPTVLSITFQAGYGYVIPIYHFEHVWSYEELTSILEGFQNLMEDVDVVKIGHNIKFDLHVYKEWFKGDYRGLLHDTMIMHHLIDENSLQDLETVSVKFFPECYGYSISPSDWAKVPLEELSYYASIDTNNTFRLKVVFEDFLLDDPELYNYYCNVSIPLLKTLERMEYDGVYVSDDRISDSIAYSKDVIDSLYKELRNYKEVLLFERHVSRRITKESIAKIESKVKKTKNDEEKLQTLRACPETYEVNFASPKQLAELLYSEEGFNFIPPKDCRTGQPMLSTGVEVLQDIDHPFITLLQTYRSALKIMGTYFEGLQKASINGKIHTTFLQHGTVTGRLSSRNPNLQNLIMRTKYERLQGMVDRVKQLFIPPQGKVFVGADLSQAELRVIASVSQDPEMIKAYNEGLDLHTTTGARLAGVGIEDFKAMEPDKRKNFRQIAKSANFGYVYGLSVEGYQNYVKLQTGKDISKKEAAKHREAIFGTYKMLDVWHNKVVSYAKEHRFVRTLFGRKRHLPEINFTGKLGEEAQKHAINAPIQGTSAEWCNLIMILGSMITPPYVQWFNTIHDAIYFYCPEDKLHSVVEVINDIAMWLPVDAIFDMDKFKVKMKLEFSVSDKDWASVEEIEI